jgi:hypothetical protein
MSLVGIRSSSCSGTIAEDLPAHSQGQQPLRPGGWWPFALCAPFVAPGEGSGVATEENKWRLMASLVAQTTCALLS